ncbi:DUF4083 family protein [Psychrobacillus sp.]|uniref:DUF4083 family protein n=1 Tax=Psychrobacillus sp. TaxID=1871623 RepID=UPI0028BEBDAD|nr:DUF4083 family protein [Psychrobacillus sp.]
MNININDLLFTLFLLTLILIGVISFLLFIRRLLINSSLRNNNSNEIETKLDKIIDLLEKKPH